MFQISRMNSTLCSKVWLIVFTCSFSAIFVDCHVFGLFIIVWKYALFLSSSPSLPYPPTTPTHPTTHQWISGLSLVFCEECENVKFDSVMGWVFCLFFSEIGSPWILSFASEQVARTFEWSFSMQGKIMIMSLLSRCSLHTFVMSWDTAKLCSSCCSTSCSRLANCPPVCTGWPSPGTHRASLLKKSCCSSSHST